MKSKNYIKLFLSLSCASVLLVTSCRKEPAEGGYAVKSSAQEKETLQDASKSIGDAASDIASSPGVGAVASFASLTKTTSKKASFIREQVYNRMMNIVNASKNVASKKSSYKTASDGTTEEASFPEASLNFDEVTGTYTWDEDADDFVFSKGSGKIVMYFPADTANRNNNNGVLTISNYNEVQVADSIFRPTSLSADLKVDNNELARLSFSASWDPQGLPLTLDLLVYLKPLTLTVNLSNSGAVATGSLSLVKEGDNLPIIAFGARVEFTDPSRQELSSVTDAYFQVKSIRVEGGITNLNSIVDGEGAEDNMDIRILVDGAQVGKLIVENDELMVKFSDGTTEPASNYFDSMKPSDDNVAIGQ